MEKNKSKEDLLRPFLIHPDPHLEKILLSPTHHLKMDRTLEGPGLELNDQRAGATPSGF